MLSLAACRDLPSLEHDVCGNGVVEEGEDCDGVSDNMLACAPADAAFACRYTCESAAGCPVGWACAGHVCIHGTNDFLAEPPVAFAHADLAIGDVDGDGRGDIVAFGTRGAQVLFASGMTAIASPDPVTGTSVVADLDRDGRVDMIAPMAQGLAVARGEADRTLTPESYAPFLASEDAWFVPTRVPLDGEGDVLAAFVPAAGATNIVAYHVPSGVVDHTTTIDVPTAALGPTALRGDLDARYPGDELVVAAAGRATVWKITPTISLAGFVAMSPSPIDLPVGTNSDGRLLLVDYEPDGDLDVLAGVQTATGPGVALLRNDGTTFTAQLVTQRFLDVGSDPFPLAVADLDDDDDLDAVSADAVLLRDASDRLVPAYSRATAAAWREAVITDVDGNRRPDVVVASEGVGLDVLRNRPAGFARVAIDVAGPTALLRAGDFDGNGFGDVVFRERTDRDRVRVLFGDAGAFAPSVAAIGLPAVHRLEVGRFRDQRDPDDAVDDLVLLGNDGTNAGVSFAAGSGDRRVRSTLFLTRNSRSDSPIGVVAGRFLTSSGKDLVVLAADARGQRRLWQLAGPNELAYRVDQALVAAPLGALAPLVDPKLAAADVDGDGTDELFALGADATDTGVLVEIGLRGGDPPGVEPVPIDIGRPHDLVAADLDGDHRSELLIAGSTALLLLRGGVLVPIGAGASSVAVAQLDGDPALEIVFIGAGTLSIVDGATLAVERSMPTTATLVRAGDLDGDGVDDLLLGDAFNITRMHSITQVPR